MLQSLVSYLVRLCACQYVVQELWGRGLTRCGGGNYVELAEDMLGLVWMVFPLAFWHGSGQSAVFRVGTVICTIDPLPLVR
jgi:hypothetical protein